MSSNISHFINIQPITVIILVTLRIRFSRVNCAKNTEHNNNFDSIWKNLDYIVSLYSLSDFYHWNDLFLLPYLRFVILLLLITCLNDQTLIFISFFAKKKICYLDKNLTKTFLIFCVIHEISTRTSQFLKFSKPLKFKRLKRTASDRSAVFIYLWM